MLVEAVERPSINNPAAAPGAAASTSRGLLAIVELYQRARKLHERDSTSIISRSILRDLVSALHFRDRNTFLHSQRVGQLAVGLASHLYWNEETVHLLEVAALLHDIGKIGIPDHILYKPGQFTGDETSLMALSTEIANDILQICHVNPNLRQAIIESRMHYSFLEDQTRELGQEISLAGRLLAVADVYESLSRDQVFRKAFTHLEIIDYLNEQAGKQFDPNMVTALTRWLKPDILSQIRSGSNQNNSAGNQSELEGTLAIASLCNVFTDLYSLESSFDGILITDENREIVLISRGVQSLYGHKEQEPVPVSWSPELFPIADPFEEKFPEGAYPYEQVEKTKRSSSLNVKLPGSAGKWLDVELQSLPLINFNNQFQGIAEFCKYKNHSQQQSTQYRELALQASRDALTGVANRGELENQLSMIMEKFKADTQGSIFSVIYLDIDHFKNINDTYGHAAGDEVLIKLARLLQREAYSSEFVARYGGEEFVIICPDLQLMQAAGRAERFRLEVAKLKFESVPSLSITSSFGVAVSEADDSLGSLLKRADKALYQSKREGRNRTTALEREEIESSKPGKKGKDDEDFVFIADMNCMLHEEILVMKLKGYVQENKARLISIEEGKAIIQVGREGLFVKWGKKEKRQPIQINIDATDALRPATTKSPKRKVKIKISPVGVPGSREIFQHRARLAFRDLRSHFIE